jgi:MoCo/4Fe-4S cofactor protein with predicted Tat translocation signal
MESRPSSLQIVQSVIDKSRDMSEKRPLDLATIRQRLFEGNGRQYWRSLEQVADTEEFREFLHREFPREASVWEDGVSRRNFLKIMGASLSLAGLSACVKQPDEKIIPYVKQPEIMVPGKPLSFATAFTMSGYATGILVTSNMGRPTKIEGNPDHPYSLGSTDVFAQGSILSLYDPDRSQVVVNKGSISTWGKFLDAIQLPLDIQRSLKGAGLRILTETVTSPTLGSQIKALLEMFPQAKWHQFEPVNLDSVRDGSIMAFGEHVQTHYSFDKADIILALDADFLGSGPAHVRYARDFAARRRVEGSNTDMNRLYVAESTPSITGGMADHRMRVKASYVESIAHAVAAGLGVTGVNAPSLNGKETKWVNAVVRDLQKHRGASIVIAGVEQPAGLHVLAHAMNHLLENNGKTVTYSDVPEVSSVNKFESLQSLVHNMNSGAVDLLIVLGGNPVYDAPRDVDFADAVGKVKFSVRLGLYEDETSERCTWHIPESHYLEVWSDARAFDGTVTIAQPLIAPLYSTTKSSHELLDEFMGNPGRKGYDIVTENWRRLKRGLAFDEFWRTTLNNGVVAETALPMKSVSLEISPESWKPVSPVQGMELVFRPDPTIWDGHHANNGWLQELPKPITKLTWDNAAYVSPATAERLSVQNEDVVELKCNGQMVEAPIWIWPGHPDDSVTLHFGYGRTRAGKVGNAIGVNAYLLRASTGAWIGQNLEVRKTGKRHPLASTQDHSSMEGRELVRQATLEEYIADPIFAKKMEHEPTSDESLYPERGYDGYSWGMTIDLNKCTGCNACVIACQSENNIPVVGKQEVERGREMHWIRIDRYYEGDLDEPETHVQPVTCMHCEMAPCEVVCPVAATTHDSEGLNVMTYNRCVGTRYCANNCPYKVRRFNFLQYSNTETETYKMMQNPDVTVRNRGVMEKCTYCVQRISHARINAKIEGRSIKDGEVVTACQSACPSQAIAFGDINDKNSVVSKLKADPRDYNLLGELNTKPRTSYLAKIKNPNPDLEHMDAG